MTYIFYRPLEFLNCSDPLDLNGNATRRQELGYGCTKVSMITKLLGLKRCHIVSFSFSHVIFSTGRNF